MASLIEPQSSAPSPWKPRSALLGTVLANRYRITSFIGQGSTGAVFRADDMTYRGQYQLPAEFWKVVVMRKADRKLSATAYLQTQKNLLEDLEFAYGAYRTYQVPVTRIEAITGLDFGSLRDHDPLADVESAGPARVIGEAADIRL